MEEQAAAQPAKASEPFETGSRQILTQEQIQAAVAKLKQGKKLYTPTAEVISHRPKDQFATAISDGLKFTPSSNPHPARVAAIKAALQELLAGLPDGDLYDAVHESMGTENGHQIMVRLTRHVIPE